MSAYPSSGVRRRRRKPTPPTSIEQRTTRALTNELAGFTTFDSPAFAALYAELRRRDRLPHWATAPTGTEGSK